MPLRPTGQSTPRDNASIYFLKDMDMVSHLVDHAELLATYHRAAADAKHKTALIQTVANKGPKAIEAAVDTAAKAVKRRNSFAAKLASVGVQVPHE